MTLFLVIILALSACVIIGSFAALIRNNHVAEFRMKMLRQVGNLCRWDIEMNRPWEWRYEEMEKISYNDMMKLPWKRLKPFNYYKDLSFLIQVKKETHEQVK